MRKKKRNRRYCFCLFLLMAALLLADSAGRVVVSEYTLRSSRVPQMFDGFRVVQLSDVHGAQYGENNGVLLKKLREAKPDLIALTGDLIDKNSDLSVVDGLLEKLANIAPVYFVSGNHEWGDGNFEGLKGILEKHGVCYLQNGAVRWERGGESIVVAGVEDPNGRYDMPTPDQVVDIINDEQGDIFTLLLAHRNYWIEKYPQLAVDVILCGHAHGGIIRLPFVGGVLGTGFELFPEYEAGIYESGRYTMIVSRGLGSAPIPRFLNNPEIVCVTLKSE